MNIKQRARDLLTCDELRGRVPEEVQDFLRDVVALEPDIMIVNYSSSGGGRGSFVTARNKDAPTIGEILYTLGADHDPA